MISPYYWNLQFKLAVTAMTKWQYTAIKFCNDIVKSGCVRMPYSHLPTGKQMNHM